MGHRWVYVAFGFVAAVVFAAIAILQRPIAFPLDDAYITLHNAQVLLSGHDPNYGVPAMVGATSLVHLFLVAAAMVVLPPVLASTFIGGIAVVLYVLGLLRMAFALGASARVAALIALLGCLTGFASFQLFNGLETGLAMAAVAWSFALAAQPVPTRRLPVLCGLLPFIRPELALLSALLMSRQGATRLKRGEPRSGAADLALMAAAAMPWLVWQWTATGALVPNTVGAKTAYFADAGLPLSSQVRLFLGGLIFSPLYPTMGVVLVLVRRWRRLPLATVGAAFTVLLLAADFLVLPGALYWNYGRYTYVLLPALLAALAAMAAQHRSLTILLAILLVPAIAQTVKSARTYLDERQWTLTELVDVARWSRANLPPDAPVLIHDAGYLAYATDLRLVDVVGLKTPESIPYHQRYTRPTGGTSRDIAVDAIARRWRIKYAIVLHDSGDLWTDIDAGLVRHGWRLDLLRRPAGQYGYFVYRVTPPPRDPACCLGANGRDFAEADDRKPRPPRP